ncbi:hypothetical protein DFS34DRAFT_667064 [Phlyctochytrium arcticum]|nr:hypothetical protein DFS34DRAFT_667064 [Phlyctochytrium arcticum]
MSIFNSFEDPIHRGLLALKQFAIEDQTKGAFQLAAVLSQDLEMFAARFVSLLDDGAKAYLRAGCINEADHLRQIQPGDTKYGVYVVTVDHCAYAGSGTGDNGGMWARARDHLNPGYRQQLAQARYRRYRVITPDSTVAVYIVLLTDALSAEEVVAFEYLVQVLGKFYRNRTLETCKNRLGLGRSVIGDYRGLNDTIALGYFGTRDQLAQWGRAGVQSQRQQNGVDALTGWWVDEDNQDRQVEMTKRGRKTSAVKNHANLKSKLHRYLEGCEVRLTTRRSPKASKVYVSQDLSILGREVVTLDRAGLASIIGGTAFDELQKVHLTVEVADPNTHHPNSYLPHELDREHQTGITRIAFKLRSADSDVPWTFYNRLSTKGKGSGKGMEKRKVICEKILRAYNDDDLVWDEEIETERATSLVQRRRANLDGGAGCNVKIKSNNIPPLPSSRSTSPLPNLPSSRHPRPTPPFRLSPTPLEDPNTPLDAPPRAPTNVNLVLSEEDDQQIATLSQTPFDPDTEVTRPIATILNQALEILTDRFLSLLTDGAKAYLRDGCIKEADHLNLLKSSDTKFGVSIFTVNDKAYAGSGTRTDKGGLGLTKRRPQPSIVGAVSLGIYTNKRWQYLEHEVAKERELRELGVAKERELRELGLAKERELREKDVKRLELEIREQVAKSMLKFAVEDGTTVVFPVATVLCPDLQFVAHRFLSLLTDKAKAYVKDECVDEHEHLDEMTPSHTSMGVYIFTVDQKKAYAGSGTGSKGGLYARARDHLRAEYHNLPGQGEYRRYYKVTNKTKLAVYVVLHTDGLSREEIITFECLVQVLGTLYRNQKMTDCKNRLGLGCWADRTYRGLNDTVALGYYGTREQLAQWGSAGIQSQRLMYGGKDALTRFMDNEDNQDDHVEIAKRAKKVQAIQGFGIDLSTTTI